jgi:hypothetical protein
VLDCLRWHLPNLLLSSRPCLSKKEQNYLRGYATPASTLPDAMRTHGTTVAAWTSNPAQRGYSNSIGRLPS